MDIEERDEGARPETWVKCWGGAVDLVSADRNRPDRRRSERKTLPRNLLPDPLRIAMGRPLIRILFPSVTFSVPCKIFVTPR